MVAHIWKVLEGVPDPEIPILSLVDLGIVRYVRCEDGEAPRVGLTPTYSGCPATEVIRASVEEHLAQAGHGDVIVEEVLTPPWTSDWLSADGRRKLQSYGIAPPAQAVSNAKHLFRDTPVVACPRCSSTATERVSEFGSTPCKAHYRCTTCLEPFDCFKCI